MRRRAPRLARVVPVGGLAAVLVMALAGCPATVRKPVEFSHVTLTDDRTLEMSVDSCNGNPEVTELEQTETEVRLEVTSTVPGPGQPGNDCMDGIEVTLDAPLGDRVLVDARTGDAVEVSAPET